MVDTVAAVILAGGLARRMGGGDKGRLLVGGRSILARTVEILRPQAGMLALSANGDPARFADLGLPVLPDSLPGHPGPLAGVLAGLDWAAGHGASWLVSAPSDCPFLPADLVPRLVAARGPAGFACAASGGRLHHAAALWPVACRGELRSALLAGMRRVGGFARDVGVAEWPATPLDPFLNVNDAAGLAEARRAAMPSPAAPPSSATPPRPPG